MKTITITRSVDRDGETAIATVPISNGLFQAVLNLSDFYMLMEMKVSPKWRYVTGQVYESGKAKLNIPRLICDIGVREKIQYLNRNPLDLRRSNLVLSVGGGKSRERDKLNRDFGFIKEPIDIKYFDINPSYMQQINYGSNNENN